MPASETVGGLAHYPGEPVTERETVSTQLSRALVSAKKRVTAIDRDLVNQLRELELLFQERATLRAILTGAGIDTPVLSQAADTRAAAVADALAAHAAGERGEVSSGK